MAVSGAAALRRALATTSPVSGGTRRRRAPARALARVGAETGGRRAALLAATAAALGTRASPAHAFGAAPPPPPYAPATADFLALMRDGVGGDAEAAAAVVTAGAAWDKAYHISHKGHAQSFSKVSKVCARAWPYETCAHARATARTRARTQDARLTTFLTLC